MRKQTYFKVSTDIEKTKKKRWNCEDFHGLVRVVVGPNLCTIVAGGLADYLIYVLQIDHCWFSFFFFHSLSFWLLSWL